MRSGIRFDYVLADRAHGDEFLRELVEHHVSGQLKVAPEHVSDAVLAVMGKPQRRVYERFVQRYARENERLGKRQYLVPYLMSSHPGSTLDEAVELAEYCRDLGYMPEQVQDFYPTPGSMSTAMYYTGVDPRTMEPVTCREARTRRRFSARSSSTATRRTASWFWKHCGKRDAWTLWGSARSALCGLRAGTATAGQRGSRKGADAKGGARSAKKGGGKGAASCRAAQSAKGAADAARSVKGDGAFRTKGAADAKAARGSEGGGAARNVKGASSDARHPFASAPSKRAGAQGRTGGARAAERRAGGRPTKAERRRRD